MIPDQVRTGVEHEMASRGLGRHLRSASPVGGGCINHGARIATDTGMALFLKWNPSSPAGVFAAEAEALLALAAGSSLRLPEPIAWREHADEVSWLLMEFIAPGPTTRETERALGQGLAEMHARDAPGGFGWERDNWIGSLPQANEPSPGWGEFWRDLRIEPQLVQARKRGLALHTDFDRVLELIPRALAGIERPALVHGDLWGGNWFTSVEGEPVLIDPAAYRGHGEVDLAMSELFGGFGAAFYEAYDDVAVVEEAYSAYRKDLYQLYYLLVHVNLFGGGYEGGSLRAARRVIGELG